MAEKLKPNSMAEKDTSESIVEKVKPDRDTGGLFRDTSEKVAKKTRKAASKTIDKGIDKGIDTVSDKAGIPKPNKLARKLAAKALKAVLKRAAESGGEVVRAAADRAVEASKAASKDAEAKITQKRPPVQASVDVGVPIRVAWEEWENFQFIPEGTHTVSEIERDGENLFGLIEGVTSSEWEAEILDEREQQSFAWQSHTGADCAGLITFHELAERLTRLELNLDIVPTSLVEMISLATHRADHKAEADLRKFKAHLELIDPDVYEEDEPAEPEDEEEPEPTDEESQDEESEDDEPQDEESEDDEPQDEDEDEHDFDDDEENLDDEDEDEDEDEEFDDVEDEERTEQEQAA
jgi:uncharacterized membrane protein